ncbi:hypothetical protein V2J52_11265 [Georgenia sp. MJ173]|uniref:hypothetical protein n=1 Tax=Georgenia sunbinii TaxID=3117728 RepID=UPI002F25F8AF
MERGEPVEPPPSAEPAPGPPQPGSRRFPRSAVLGTHLRRTDAALERQRSHVDAAREAVAVLRDLRDDLVEQAVDETSSHRADALQAQAAALTAQLADLERQLETLEEADATARTRAVGLRHVEESAGSAVPFRVAPMSADILDGLTDRDGLAGRPGSPGQ